MWRAHGAGGKPIPLGPRGGQGVPHLRPGWAAPLKGWVSPPRRAAFAGTHLSLGVSWARFGPFPLLADLRVPPWGLGAVPFLG